MGSVLEIEDWTFHEITQLLKHRFCNIQDILEIACFVAKLLIWNNNAQKQPNVSF